MTRPLYDFHIITGITFVLLTIGLMMVLSSSSVVAYLNTGSPYSLFLPQVIYATLGVVIFVAVVRMPTEWIRAAAVPALVVFSVLLILVLFVGEEQMGAKAWFAIGGFSFQPSEFTRVALAVWASHLIATFTAARIEIDRALPGLAAVSVVLLALVVLQRDLGMMIILGIIFMSALWYGGFNIRWFFGIAAGAVTAALILGLTAGYRSDRIQAFLSPDHDPQGLNYQSRQAMFALANGGFFGTGLGQSDAKWSYLPQAYNDFIFAVVGEELGLVGALGVIALFAAVAMIGMRISRRATDPFLKVLIAVATTWIVAQAAINIGCVIGLLPVTGLQLPLISAGGTSMLSTMAMFGLIAHAAFREPEAMASLRTGHRKPSARVFGVPREPVRRSPTARYVRRAGHDPKPRQVRRAEVRRTADSRRGADPRRTAEPRRKVDPRRSIDPGRGQRRSHTA